MMQAMDMYNRKLATAARGLHYRIPIRPRIQGDKDPTTHQRARHATLYIYIKESDEMASVTRHLTPAMLLNQPTTK